MIELSINGRKQRFGTSTNIVQLIDAMALTGKRIAIERNGEIVPRSRHAETWLANGDRLEIVVAVGGG